MSIADTAEPPDIYTACPVDDQLIGWTLLQANERLLDPKHDEPQAILQNYFKGVREFAKEYRAPSPSPEPSDLSSRSHTIPSPKSSATSWSSIDDDYTHTDTAATQTKSSPQPPPIQTEFRACHPSYRYGSPARDHRGTLDYSNRYRIGKSVTNQIRRGSISRPGSQRRSIRSRSFSGVWLLSPERRLFYPELPDMDYSMKKKTSPITSFDGGAVHFTAGNRRTATAKTQYFNPYATQARQQAFHSSAPSRNTKIISTGKKPSNATTPSRRPRNTHSMQTRSKHLHRHYDGG